METHARICQWLFLLTVITYTKGQTYKEPPDIYDNIQYKSKVVATSLCGASEGCSGNGCMNTRQSPDPWIPIQAEDSCIVNNQDTQISIPSAINGSVMFMNITNNGSCSNNTAVTPTQGYTLSFWVNLNLAYRTGVHDSVQLFSIGSVSVSLGYDRQLTINNSYNSNSQRLNNYTWHHVVLRHEKNNGASVIIDGERNLHLPYMSNALPASFTSIDFNPVLNSSSDSFYLADFRFYSDYLTQRDIDKIRGSSSSPNITAPECRCPKFYADLDQFDPEGLYCLEPSDNPDLSTPRTLRLQPERHYPVFVTDKNESTTWRSGRLSNSPKSITITLTQTYMIEKVKIYSSSDTAIPQTITYELIRDNGESSLFSSENPASVDSKYEFDFRTNLSLSESSSRTDVEKIVAKSIKITLAGNRGGRSYYEIEEILITGRCYCHGVANACTRYSENTTYQCNCSAENNGSLCELCDRDLYRRKEEFQCSTTCRCNSTGTLGDTNKCESDGGQCKCKPNVDLRDCSQCKHMHYNLTSSGCQGCNCDLYGTVSCDKTSGNCTCKNKVEGDTCDSCEDKHYGRDKPEGCIMCNCSVPGSVSGSRGRNCHAFNGQCNCKENVQGLKCDECKDYFYNLDVDRVKGCKPCGCSLIGSVNNMCNKDTGQCQCHPDVDVNQHKLCSGGNCKECQPKADGKLIPRFGPLAGGTRVTLIGVFFGHNVSQTQYRVGNSTNYQPVSRINDTSLEFITRSQTSLGIQNVYIQWRAIFPPGSPNTDLLLPNFTFEYRSNPSVTSVSSLKSFKSGGCAVTVRGQGLNSIAYPKLIVYNENFSETVRTSCSVMSDGKSMKCDSPMLSPGRKVTYGLHLDGEMKYKDLSGMNLGDNTITATEDPTVNQAQGDDEFTPVFDDKFMIVGDNLLAGCSKDDFSVDCGSEVTCTIESITSSKITVVPKFDFPGPGMKVKLKVKIGNKEHLAQEINFRIFWETWQFILIAAGGGVFLIGIMVIIVICRCCCSRRTSKSDMKSDMGDANSNNVGSEVQLTNIDTIPGLDNNPEKPRKHARPNQYEGFQFDKENWDSFIHRLNDSVRKLLDFSHTDMNDIEPGRRCINKGEHIRIIEGKFKEGTSNYLAGRPTIIKTLVSEYSTFESVGLPQWVSLGLQECLKFRDCMHENFLQMRGVATDDKRFFVLYPSYHRIFKDYLNDKAIQDPLRDLIHFCLQVSDGLKYLHEFDIVHKDLAARNCVITEDRIVMISDAAFSWDIFPNEYMYDERREKYLPVRWMALESLKMGFYDKSSDIWTLGVLIWEVMFEGNSLPYPDVADNKQIKDHVDSGYRLGKSHETPESLYQLMLRCWESDSSSRVKLDEIIETLSKMVDPDNFGQNGLYINEDETMELYQNTSFTNQAFQQ